VRRLLTLLPLAAFLVLAGYFALALRPGRDPEALPSALIDKPVPDFALPALLDGAQVAAAGLRGQVAVINFFASWCVPCRVEHPVLMRLAQREKLPLVGIAYKDKPEAARRFLAGLGDPYARVGLDETGRTGIDFGVYGVPETYVVDRTGHIRKRFVGPLTQEAAERELLPLVRTLERP
jgi:cytochrome c biogenesis protein CcmG/thiol:disulfide interchange protein DsbE